MCGYVELGKSRSKSQFAHAIAIVNTGSLCGALLQVLENNGDTLDGTDLG